MYLQLGEIEVVKNLSASLSNR